MRVCQVVDTGTGEAGVVSHLRCIIAMVMRNQIIPCGALDSGGKEHNARVVCWGTTLYLPLVVALS